MIKNKIKLEKEERDEIKKLEAMCVEKLLFIST